MRRHCFAGVMSPGVTLGGIIIASQADQKLTRFGPEAVPVRAHLRPPAPFPVHSWALLGLLLRIRYP